MVKSKNKIFEKTTWQIVKKGLQWIGGVWSIKKINKVVSIKLVKGLAPFFELYYRIRKKTPLFTKYSLYTLKANANFTNAKAKKELAYQPRNIKYTIEDLVKEINEKHI